MVQQLNNYWVSEADKFHQIDNVEREILLPYVANLINDIAPKKMLDFGCGNAYLSSLINSGTEISLYDINPSFIELHKQWNIKNEIKPILSKEEIPDEHFDIVVQTSVLMCIPNIKSIKEIFHSNNKSLKKDGVLLIVITHPCFLQYEFGHYHTSFNQENFQYLKDGLEYSVYMKQKNAETIIFTDYNWSLSTIINELIKADFTLNHIVEHPDLESKDYKSNGLVPSWLFIKAKKN